MPNPKLDQLNALIRDTFCPTLSTLYRGFINEGLTEEAAIRLTQTYFQHILTYKGPSNEDPSY